MNPSVGSTVSLGSANFGEYLNANVDTLSTFNTVANQLVVNYDALMWDGTIWADLNNFEDATQNTIDFAKPVIITVNSDTVYKTPGINIGN